VENDAGGGTSWAQSKNMLEDLMGHTAEKPPRLAKWNTSSENEITELKPEQQMKYFCSKMKYLFAIGIWWGGMAMHYWIIYGHKILNYLVYSKVWSADITSHDE
jgi:hypothetical protein